MQCPFCIAAEIAHGTRLPLESFTCGKEVCAWWDPEKNCCSIRVIARALDYLMIKMSHVEQFKR